MQSKPGSINVIYLNFDGEVLTGDTHPILGNSSISNYFGWVWFANRYDVDGTRVDSEDLKISSIKVPPAPTYVDRANVLKQVANKFDIFDVNITDERSVYEGAVGFKTMALITSRPSVADYNQLIINRDKSENGPWPYSYRRFLRFRFKSGYSFYLNAGIAGPPSEVSIFLRGFTRHLFVWTNSLNITDSAPRAIPGYQSEQSSILTQIGSEVIYPTKIIARTVAHEVGHKFGLLHDGQMSDTEYYLGHNDWSPIMGGDTRVPRPLSQWSKGEYNGSTHLSAGRNISAALGSLQDDLNIIGKNLGFIKSPKDSIPKKQIRARDYEIYEYIANLDGCWSNMGNLGFNIRVIDKSDVTSFNGKKVIEGMIGFPGDFEIIKMLLPRGTYNFTIDPLWHNPESMLDVKIEILNCHCHRPKEKYPVNCNQQDLPTRYPIDKPDENFQCISFDQCLDDYNNLFRYPAGNDTFSAVTTEDITLPYTQIVYLLVSGHRESPLFEGWSVYSSVGKYYLQITKDGNNNPENFLQEPASPPLPVCNCEEFNDCNKTLILFTQENNEDKGTEDQTYAYIKEIDIVINGKMVNKKFLVSGPSLELNSREEPGKFYLQVVENGKVKKQEFVVGSDWEKKKI